VDAEDVLSFWFPREIPAEDLPAQFDWWFRGGADPGILDRFAPHLELAIGGALDRWADTARARLALVIVLDQFSRTLFRGTARAFAQDAKALALAREGIAIGHYDALASPWEKTFLQLPLAHSEDLACHELSVRLTARLAEESPPELREALEFSASQARGHRDVVARFGRHPHRNAVLGRPSTPEELDYLGAGQLVHTRRMRG